MDNIKTWTGLSVEESIRMTEDRDKWRKYVHATLGSRTAKEQNRTEETVSGNGISWAICKSAPQSRQITMPSPHHSVFLQA